MHARNLIKYLQLSLVEASLSSMSDTDSPVKRTEQPKELSHDPERLVWRRYAAGMSQVAAATAAGCTKSNLSKLEHGEHGASAELLSRLAEVYGCQITDLMQPEPGTRPAKPKGVAA